MTKRKRTKSISKKTVTIDLRKQITTHAKTKPKKVAKYEGNDAKFFSTGSTQLDLAISGGRVRGGGLPSSILVIVFGPSGAGKTVLASEFAGAIQRKGGLVKFRDTEGRFNKKFAETFDIDLKKLDYDKPDTISKVFKEFYKWNPDNGKTNALIIDSLAALSTELEMGKEDTDNMASARRGKEFSEALRKSKNKISSKDYIIFATNQERDDIKTGYSPGGGNAKPVSPGGKALRFYASLILRFVYFKKIYKKVKVKGQDVKRVVGIECTIEVDKSSIWKPYRTADLTINFDYGIDDIRDNLLYLKKFKGTTITIEGHKLNLTGKGFNSAINTIEANDLEEDLKNEVIDIWEEIESKFDVSRKKKKR